MCLSTSFKNNSNCLLYNHSWEVFIIGIDYRQSSFKNILGDHTRFMYPVVTKSLVESGCWAENPKEVQTVGIVIGYFVSQEKIVLKF